MKKTIIILIFISILTKMIGFGREIVLTYFYGATNISDAYLISMTIPTIIFGFIGLGVKSTFMPLYSEILNNEGIEEAENFMNRVIKVLFYICTLLVLLVLIFTEKTVFIFASGFDNDTLELAIKLTRVSIFSVYFIGLNYIFEGYLQINNSYKIPALVSLPFNLIIITTIVLSYNYGLMVLGVGITIGYFMKISFMLPSVIQKSYKHNLRINLRDEKLKEMMTLSLPIILGSSVFQINQLVDRTLASQVAVGGISALNYSAKINDFIQAIFITSLVTVLYVRMSKKAATRDIVGMKKELRGSINAISILVIPSSIGCMFFSTEIITLLFGRGSFDAYAISLTAVSLFFYSIGLVAYGMRQVLNRAFYALKETKVPTVNASIAMGTNIVLNVIFAKLWGVAGIAFATSLSTIICTLLLFVSIHKKIGPFGMKQISVSFIKILFASLVMGGLARVSYNYLNTLLTQNLSLLVGICVGVVSYFVIIYFMKIEDVDVVISAIKNKLGRSTV